MKCKLTTLLILSGIILSSCGGSGDTEAIAQEEQMLDSIMNQSSPELEFSDEAVQEIMKSIPSPLEMAALIKESGAEFEPKMLNDPDLSENYSSIYTKALNLGVYGADMGYINLYEKTSHVFSYLTTIKGLADDLKIGHFFDFSTLKRLASNNSNMDSLLYISTSSFEDMDKYLKKNKRGNISLLILLGGWLESLHIATYVANLGTIDENYELVQRIGEQKIVLNDILLLLGVYDKDPNTKVYKEKFEQLKGIYDQVNIVYEYSEPETMEVDGMLVIVDNSSSRVEIDQEKLDAITSKVNEIRNEIIQ